MTGLEIVTMYSGTSNKKNLNQQITVSIDNPTNAIALYIFAIYLVFN